MLQVLIHLIQLLERDFIDLKGKVEKLGINKLVNAPTSLNNLKAKVADLDAGKLKTIPVDLKKISDIVDNEVAKKHKIQHTKDTSK